jgi:hypothetical protein
MKTVPVKFAFDKEGKTLQVGDTVQILRPDNNYTSWTPESESWQITALFSILDHSSNVIGHEAKLCQTIPKCTKTCIRDTSLLRKVIFYNLKNNELPQEAYQIVDNVCSDKKWWLHFGSCPKCRDGTKPNCYNGSFICPKCNWIL